MDESQYCLIQFQLAYKNESNIKPRIVGNNKDLGNWEISQSLQMIPTKKDPYIWKTRVFIKSPHNSEIQYKYVFFKDDSFFEWESLPNNGNRIVKVTNQKCIIVNDTQKEEEEVDNVSLNENVGKNNKNSSRNSVNPENSQNMYPTLNCDTTSNFDETEVESVKTLDSLKERNLEKELDQLNPNITPKKNRTLIFPSLTYKDKTKLSLTSEEEIIMCSLYLPMSPIKINGKWVLRLTSEPIYHTLNKITQNEKRIKWIGIVKNYNNIDSDEEKERLLKELETNYNMYGLRITKEQYNSLLLLFTELIEPQFHYISISQKFEKVMPNIDDYWELYRDFNEMISKQILKLVNSTENCVIFLHDYHFFFVPSLVYSFCTNFYQEKVQHISIGFFMHNPFPDEEVFKNLVCREEIMKSIMNCSVIGFHTFNSCRNFLSNAKTILGVEYESTLQGDFAISYFGRKVIIRVKNITPDLELIKDDYNSKLFQSKYKEMKEKYKNRFVFVSIDHIQFLSTTIQKLEGYRRFLRDINIKYHTKTIFLLYIKLSSNNFKSENEIIYTTEQNEHLAQIKQLVDEIKKEFGEHVLSLFIQQISYIERLAFCAVADCYMRTSKKESFSLGVYEFLILKTILNDTKNVEYIISELSGVNSSLAHTIKINPFDPGSIHQGFIRAFQPCIDQMNHVNKEKDFALVKKSSARDWLFSFCDDIKKFKNFEQDIQYFGSGIGLSFRLMKTQGDFKVLNLHDIAYNFSASSKRMFLLNFEEVGQPHQKSKKLNTNNFKDALTFIDILSNDPKNQIFILSSKNQSKLEEEFKNYPKLHLVSEKGYSYKYSRRNYWERISNEKNEPWILLVKKFLEPYTEQCEGATIKIHDASIIWDYTYSDGEMGTLYAKMIMMAFNVVLKNLNLKIAQGSKSIEIYNKKVNKGSFASFAIKDFIKKNSYAPDFILAIGNDDSDEILFKYLNSKKKEIKKFMKSNNGSIYTVLIGKKPSFAKYFVNSLLDCKNIFEEFCKSSAKQRTSKSFYNFKAVWENVEPNQVKDFSANNGAIQGQQ